MSILYNFLSRATALLRLGDLFYTVPIMTQSNDSTKASQGSVKGYVA